MEDPLSYSLEFSFFLLSGFSQGQLLQLIVLPVVMLILLLLSALVSASEVAFFGLSKTEINELDESSKQGKVVSRLMDEPKKLLTTILIFNNSLNIGLVILSTIFFNQIKFHIGGEEWIYTFIQIVLVTSFILLFGEIMPKIYATKKGKETALFMAKPLLWLSVVFYFFSMVLIWISSFFDKIFKEEIRNISVDELSEVHDMVEDYEGTEHEQKMLDGVLEFGNTDVKQVMKPRTEVVAIEFSESYETVKEVILSSGYSRIPVHDSGFDNIKGVLYIKDLLPHIAKQENFAWQDLLRQPFFVPENKKLDDLLIEFQEKKIHLAIVIDEYGGTSGLVTMEDVIEEIIGDIHDEFDDDELEYSKLGDNKYVFDGKTQLKDLYRVLDIEGSDFEENKGDSDTIAGFVLEQRGDFPKKGEQVVFDDYTFTVEAVDKKRIKRIKLEMLTKSTNGND